jgi:hypothetical protein
MPDDMPPSDDLGFGLPDSLDRMDSETRSALRPLIRLRQLACEIHFALEANDMAIVCRASSLLAPTLVQWKESCEALDVRPGEAAQIALDTYNLLRRCEDSLQSAMGRISSEMGRLTRGKRNLAAARARAMMRSTGRRIDTRQ